MEYRAAVMKPVDGADLDWFRANLAQRVASVAPPLIAPSLTTRIFPFQAACDRGGHASVVSVTGRRADWPLSDIHGYHFALHRYHDWRLLAVLQTVCRRGDSVVEVGANIGTETVPFSDVVGPTGHVYAFEPVPRNVAMLRSILDGAGVSNVTVLPFALADVPGTLPFVVPDDPRFTGTGHFGNQENGPEVIHVEVATLDAVLPPHATPSVIAMDVEGAELAVLRGARGTIARARPVIALEACARHAIRAGSTLEELFAELRSSEYQVRAIRRYGLRNPDCLPDAEPCNWVAVPDERRDLLRQISTRIFWSGVLPPWRGINPLSSRTASARESSQ